MSEKSTAIRKSESRAFLFFNYIIRNIEDYILYRVTKNRTKIIELKRAYASAFSYPVDRCTTYIILIYQSICALFRILERIPKRSVRNHYNHHILWYRIVIYLTIVIKMAIIQMKSLLKGDHNGKRKDHY